MAKIDNTNSNDNKLEQHVLSTPNSKARRLRVLLARGLWLRLLHPPLGLHRPLSAFVTYTCTRTADYSQSKKKKSSATPRADGHWDKQWKSIAVRRWVRGRLASEDSTCCRVKLWMVFGGCGKIETDYFCWSTHILFSIMNVFWSD